MAIPISALAADITLPDGPVACVRCEGTGVQHYAYTSGKKSKRCEMACFGCSGKKTMTPSQFFTWSVERLMWCTCSPPGASSDYFADGAHAGCLPKHHYHCAQCGLVSQIG
jgi:hypothetical protein